MKRLTNEQKTSIRKMALNGYSLRKIKNELNKSKTTIYYHTRKILGRKIKQIKIENNLNNIGEFMGVFAGDGSFCKSKLYHYRIILFLSAKEEDYMISLSNMLCSLFNKKPNVYFRKDHNYFEIIYNSKKLYDFIKKFLIWDGKKVYSIRLKKMSHKREFLIGFLRGFLDSDGYSCKNHRKTSFSTVSLELAKQISSILSKFKINNKILSYKKENRKRLYSVNVSGNNAVNLIRLIKPRNPSRIRKWCG